MPEVIRENGGTPVRTRVGHCFIKAVMAETGAAFGGEHSAHYYFRDNYRADSGSIAALVVLEQLCLAGVPLSELRKPFERYAALGRDQHEGRRPARRSSSGSPTAYADADQDRLDGLTVDLGDWWFNLRPSNTEPLLRLNLEAPTRRPRSSGTWPRSRLRWESRHMALDPQLLEILACPEDKGPLLYFESEDVLYNPRLKRKYAIKDDIPIMLIDEAETVDDAEHDRLMAKAEAEGIKPTFEAA